MSGLFWASAIFIVYTYAIYPLVIVLWGSLVPRRARRRYDQPPISVVLAVRDEEINVKARVDNLMAQDYPKDRVEVIVVSDGSTDRTVEILGNLEYENLKVIESPPVGKAAAVNLAVEAATNDVIVFADARQRFGENVFAELTAFFFDQRVGAVSGELIIEPGVRSDVNEGVGLYWEYEKLIRRMESAVHSVVGATGSIYAIRRSLFVPLAPNALLDDFLVPMRIVLKGYRVIFARSAKAYDIASSTASREFARKVRTLAGNFQAVAMEPGLVNPAKNPVFFQFVSHKLARLIVPYCCLVALLSSAVLSGTFYKVAFVIQAAFYAAGFLNLTPLRTSSPARLFRVAWTFMVLNAAAVAGLWVWGTGRSASAWKRTPPHTRG